jgi:hypothetical protein
MVLSAAAFGRHNRKILARGVEVLGARRRGSMRTASGTNLPNWLSRFAKSSGYEPARDGRFAPPLGQETPTKRASDQDVVRGPSAADAA